jgi:hypothetical protein
MASITCRVLASLFQVPAVVALVAEGKVVFVETSGSLEPNEAEVKAALSSSASGTVSRGGVYPETASRFDFWPVAATEAHTAIIGLALDPNDRPSLLDASVEIVANMFGLALKRGHAPID